MRSGSRSILCACLVALVLWTPAALAGPERPSVPPVGATADSTPVHIDEPVTLVVIGTIAAVTGIIAAGYGLYSWATDNFAKSAVGQSCYPPDGFPSATWSQEDSGLNWASARLDLGEVASDPCGDAYASAWANDVWGSEGSNDVRIYCTASAEQCSGPSSNQVSSAARAKADDFEVVSPAPPAARGALQDLVMTRTVEIDSLVITASGSKGMEQGDSARVVLDAIVTYDGVPDTLLHAVVSWTQGGMSVTGDLAPADVDFFGNHPTQGWLLAIFDYTRTDTVTFSAPGAEGALTVPDSVNVTVSADGQAWSEAPGQGCSITEVRLGEAGLDLNEYVEIHGSTGALLDSLTYLVVSDMPGYRGVVTGIVHMPGLEMPEDGYLLMAEQTFDPALFGTVPDVILPGFDPLPFEDAVGATHLLVSHFTGGPGMDLDGDDDGRLDLRPWSETVDCVSFSWEPLGAEAEGYCGEMVRSDTLQHLWRDCNGVTWHVGAMAPPAGDTPGSANPCPPPAGVEPPRPAGALLLGAIAPNPSADEVVFSLELPRPAHVRLRVFDVTGRPVARVADRRFAAGGHHVTWRADGALASGVYFAVVESDLGRQSRSFAVVR